MISNTFDSDQEALNFLNNRLEARERLGVEAALCLDMDVVMVKVRLGAVDELKGALESAKDTLGTIRSSDSVAFSKFYRASAEFRKVSDIAVSSGQVVMIVSGRWWVHRRPSTRRR